MTDPFRLRWRVGIFAALIVTTLSVLPQLNFWRARGDRWHGSFYSYHPDEYAYAAYVSALINGEPRRSDPYSGDLPSTESIMSIQFVPAYGMALPARLLDLSVATAFILLTPIAAFFSGLAVFGLVGHVTRDHRVAAASVLLVLCLGSFARGQWLIGFFGGWALPPIPFPFLRRYEPALPVSLFFLFCLLLWQMLNANRQKRVYLTMVGATITFGLLVFSYYFLWTAAAAVVGSLFLVSVLIRIDGYGDNLKRLSTLSGLCVLTLIPYGILLSRRHEAVDTLTELTLTHSPDFRPLSFLSLALTLLLVIAIRKQLIDRKISALFTLAMALAPVVMLNVQVIFGRSLQPQHYEAFIANYVLLVAVSLSVGLLTHSRFRKEIRGPLLLCASLLAVAYGVTESTLATRSPVNVTVDEFMPVATRLANLSNDRAETALVIHPVFQLPDVLPSVARVSVLWAPHSFAFSGLGPSKERYFQHLYYSNANLEQENPLSYARIIFRQNVFGWGRATPGLAAHAQPITDEEEAAALREYRSYAANFNLERASHPQLSFVITSVKLGPDLSRLDLWYERDQGEQVGEFMLYRVRLRVPKANAN